MVLQPGLHLFDPALKHQEQALKSIVYIQASCILNDHTMATFIPPLSYDKMYTRWTQFAAETISLKRIILVRLSRIDDRSETPADVRTPFGDNQWPTLTDGLEVAGVISLSMPDSETGPFRALVQNLFVHPLHRRKAIATNLLSDLESRAAQHGRWSLMLDTTVGTPAEKMYELRGWSRLGVVPCYGLRPTGNADKVELADEVWFWKDLRGRV